MKIVFTAHSLPQVIVEKGDPYEQQLHETTSCLVEKLALTDEQWLFSYQSEAKTPEPWLGPQIEDQIEVLANLNCKDVLIAPIGFISDHVEILYDIDISVSHIASKHGIRVERTPMLNDSKPLIDALSGIYYSQIVVTDRAGN